LHSDRSGEYEWPNLEGEKGDRGPQGPEGETLPIKGEPGDIGDDGPIGAPGNSIYWLVLAKAFTCATFSDGEKELAKIKT